MVYAFAAWTVFVWGNRISNILEDGAGEGTVEPVSLGSAVVMVALAVATAVAARWGRPAWALPALIVATAVVWAVRVPLLLTNPDTSVGFKAVHLVLVVVSGVLAWAAWRSRSSSGPGTRVPRVASR